MSSLALELHELDMEYQALESEIFLDSFIDNSAVLPYDIATEVAHSTFQAQVQNKLKRIGNWFKKLFAALPKLFQKVVNFISHSQLVTKARLKKELPKDFKELPKDKLKIVKDLRLEILTAKNQLLDASNKKMETALKLMEEASTEMSDIANIIRVGDTSRQDVIDGRVDVSKSKLDKIKSQWNTISTDGTCQKLHGKIDASVNKLQNLLENESIFEVAVPACKGENKAEYYAKRINDDCDHWKEVADRITSMMNNAYSVRHDHNLAVANKLNEKAKDKQLNVLQQSRLKRASNIADAEELSRAAGKGASHVMELINLYREISGGCMKISTEYGKSMARCFKVYGDSDEGTKQVYNQEINEDMEKDENGKKKKTVKSGKLFGDLRWDDKHGCWAYVRITQNEGGKFVESRAVLKKYTDKDNKPNLSKDLVKEIEDKLSKQQGFQRFANEGDREFLQNYTGGKEFEDT